MARTGDHAGAIAAHRTALRLRPDDALTHYNLGLALAKKGDPAGAIAPYRAVRPLRAWASMVTAASRTRAVTMFLAAAL